MARPTQLRSPRRARQGAHAIEFALCLPILLSLLTGSMDWAWYLYQTSGVTEAAWAGTRMAAGISNLNQARAAATAATQAKLTAMHLQATPTVTVTNVASGVNQVLSVAVTVPFEGTFGIVPVPPRLEGHATALWYGGAF